MNKEAALLLVLVLASTVPLMSIAGQSTSLRQPYPPNSRPPEILPPPDVIPPTNPSRDASPIRIAVGDTEPNPFDIAGYIAFTTGAMLLFRRPTTNALTSPR